IDTRILHAPGGHLGLFSASTFVDFRQVGFSKALGLSSDAFQTRSVHSNAPRDRLDEPAGLFLGAVASPQSRPPLHPAQSTYKCPNPAEVSLRSDTTFLLLPVNVPPLKVAEARGKADGGIEVNV